MANWLIRRFGTIFKCKMFTFAPDSVYLIFSTLYTSIFRFPSEYIMTAIFNFEKCRTITWIETALILNFWTVFLKPICLTDITICKFSYYTIITFLILIFVNCLDSFYCRTKWFLDSKLIYLCYLVISWIFLIFKSFLY